MGPRIVAEKTIKLAGQELLGFVTLGSLPADRVKRHFGARQWLFNAFLRVCICAHGLWCLRGKLGWGIIFPHAAVLLPLLIWTLLYAIAPLLEKPWLEREFGADYLEYKTKTLRFWVF